MTSLIRRALVLTFAAALSVGLTAGITAPAQAGKDISWQVTR